MPAKIAPDQIAKQLDAVRKKRLKKLKMKISSGKYHVSNLELVKALFLSQ